MGGGEQTWKLELWTDIKWVRFGRTELSIRASDAEFWDLSFEMDPKLSGSQPDGEEVEKLFEKLHFSSFWRFFVAKSVGLRFYELSLSVSDAEFWDLSFAMGPGAQFFQKIVIFFKNVQIFGLVGSKKWGKSEMFDEMGQNSSKFGNFDTNRCAPGVGPQKSRFWQFFPICLG